MNSASDETEDAAPLWVPEHLAAGEKECAGLEPKAATMGQYLRRS